nr:hypothetical protein [Tanacetum cinerariifolium]
MDCEVKCLKQSRIEIIKEVILFYNRLGIPTRQILDSRGAIPSKTVTDAKGSIQEMAEYSKNGTMEHLDRTMKYSKGIAENGLVGIGKFVFPIDFIILDMPEDIKVPLILGRPFLPTTRAKIDVYERKITLRVGEERICTSIKPASSLIKRVYMLSLRERIKLDLEARLMGETLVLNRSLDPFFEDCIELKDLNKPTELRRNQSNELMPTIKEGDVVEEFRARNDARMDSKVFEYPSG